MDSTVYCLYDRDDPHEHPRFISHTATPLYKKRSSLLYKKGMSARFIRWVENVGRDRVRIKAMFVCPIDKADAVVDDLIDTHPVDVPPLFNARRREAEKKRDQREEVERRRLEQEWWDKHA